MKGFVISFQIQILCFRVLSDDIHLKVQGRLHISLTKVLIKAQFNVHCFAPPIDIEI